MKTDNALKKAAVNQNGFTLVEVLVAIAIASIGLFGLSMMQGTAIQGNSFARKMTQATILAQQKIEQLKNAELDPDDVTTGLLAVTTNPEWKSESPLDENGVESDSGIFIRRYRVQANDDDAPFSRLLTVTVSWNDANGGEDNARSVELTTVTRGAWN